MPDNSYRTSNLGPKVSHTTTRAYGATDGHYLVPSWMTFEVDGPANFDGAADFDSTANFDGAVTMTAALTPSGNVNVTGTLAVGSGTSISLIQKSDVSVSLGAVAGQESVATTGTIQTLTSDAVIIDVAPESIWSGTYYQVNLAARASAASTFQIYASNVSAANITPDAMTMTLTWIDFS